MKPSLIIRIPEPCNEQWADMTVTANGRTCARCERELTDFTRFSKQELIAYAAAHEGRLCGRFAPHQLNHNLLAGTAAAYTGLSLPALALMAATLTANPAQAQLDNVPEIVTMLAQEDSLKNGTPAYDTLMGSVRDLFMGEPLPGITVELRDKGIVVARTTSDSEGRFSLIVRKDMPYDTLRAAFDGYNDTLVPWPENPTLFLEPEEIEIGEIGLIVIDKKHLRQNRRAWRREERKKGI